MRPRFRAAATSRPLPLPCYCYPRGQWGGWETDEGRWRAANSRLKAAHEGAASHHHHHKLATKHERQQECAQAEEAAAVHGIPDLDYQSRVFGPHSARLPAGCDQRFRERFPAVVGVWCSGQNFYIYCSLTIGHWTIGAIAGA